LIQTHTSIIHDNENYLNIYNLILDNKPTNKKLQAKLTFKLGCIILSLQRLINACQLNYIDDKTKYLLIKNSIINLNDTTAAAASKTTTLNIINDLDDEFDENEYEIEIERLDTDYDLIIKKHGTQLDNSKRLFIDYKEDILKSIDNEIENNLVEISKDFPLADHYVKNELKSLLIIEWLKEYKDSILEYKYSAIKNEKNEIEIYEDDDPFFIV
jgi:hypothetical protein